MVPRRDPAQLSPPVAWIGGTLLMLLMGVGDQVTSVELAFTLLYVLVLAAGSWFGGFSLGLWLSVLAVACATTVERLATQPPAVLTTVWNQTGIGAICVLVAFLIDRVHHSLAFERRERRLAVEQLRHAERLNMIGTLAAGVAHELGTPLNVISGSAELIEHAKTPAETAELARVIRTQTDRISSIIRHLLEFGRRAGKDLTALDLNDVARQSVELLRSTAGKRSVTLTFEPAAAPVEVMGNAPELEQVVSNLVLNAIQAMPDPGNVRVSVATTQRPDPSGPSGDSRAYATLSVEDHGVGIPTADLPQIFDPFFTTKGVGEGTGLGLSVSYGIVLDHDGTIEVESAPGRGSRFTVMLPGDRSPRS